MDPNQQAPTNEPTQTPAPSEAPAPNTSSERAFDPSDPVEMFRADPFDLLKDFTPQDDPQPGSDFPAVAEPQAPTPAAAPIVPATQQPAGGGEQNIAEQLAIAQAQMQNMQRLIEAGVGQRPQPQQQPQAPAAAPDTGPDFMFQLPEQLVNMVYSEDPAQRMRGLQLVVAGAAKSAYGAAMAQVEQRFTNYQPNVEQSIAKSLQQFQIFQDFYGKNDDLSAPQFRNVVQATFRDLAAREGIQGWSPAIRDRLAVEVRKRLGWPERGAQPQAPQVPAQPPRSFGNGSRPPAAIAGGDGQAGHIADIMDIL